MTIFTGPYKVSITEKDCTYPLHSEVKFVLIMPTKIIFTYLQAKVGFPRMTNYRVGLVV